MARHSDELDAELAYRYEERPTTAPVDHAAFEPSTEWCNWWDWNPITHGGRYMHWDGHGWDIIEVSPPSAWPEPEHILTPYYVEPRDVWEDPSDPWTDFTPEMKSILRSLGDSHHLPAAEPFLDRIDYYVADFAGRVGGGRTETFDCRPHEDADADDWDPGIYWDTVEGYGVDAADLVGEIADDELPSWVDPDGTDD